VAPAHLGDALRLRQILSNFISNAVKFTASGAIGLTVRVLADDGVAQSLEFSVADTGPASPRKGSESSSRSSSKPTRRRRPSREGPASDW